MHQKSQTASRQALTRTYSFIPKLINSTSHFPCTNTAACWNASPYLTFITTAFISALALASAWVVGLTDLVWACETLFFVLVEIEFHEWAITTAR